MQTYLGQGLSVDSLKWVMMLREKKRNSFLKQLLNVFWTDEELGCRALALSKVLQIYPVEIVEIEPHLLRLVISKFLFLLSN